MKLHTVKSKQKEFLRFKTESSSMKTSTFTIAIFRIDFGNISVM